MEENIEKKSLDQVEEPNLEPVAKYGFVDESGNVVIPFVWHNAKYFYEGLAAVSDGVNGYGYIDKTGKLVIPCQWFAAYDFSEGMAVVLDTDGGKYGFIDKKGDLVIPCQWDDAFDFCEGLARVQDNNEKYGFIDQTGKLVIPCQWNRATDFYNGRAFAGDDNSLIIDKTGKVVKRDLLFSDVTVGETQWSLHFFLPVFLNFQPKVSILCRKHQMRNNEENRKPR